MARAPLHMPYWRRAAAVLAAALTALTAASLPPGGWLAEMPLAAASLHLALELAIVLPALLALLLAALALPRANSAQAAPLLAGLSLMVGGGLLHMLSFPGMPPFLGLNGGPVSHFFSALARAASAAMLLALAWRVTLPGRPRHWLLAALALLLLLAAACWRWPEALLVPHRADGATRPAKLALEAAIAGANLAAAWGLRRAPFRLARALLPGALLQALVSLCYAHWWAFLQLPILLAHGMLAMANVLTLATVFHLCVNGPLARLRLGQRRLQRHQRRREQALRELRDLQGALDEHAIVAVTDARGAITMVNDKFCAISGYSRAELLGQNHRMINSGQHPPGFFGAMWRTIRAGQPWHGEICNRAKDGQLYWVQTTIVPSFGADGRPRHFIAIRADISAHKRSEEAVRQLAYHDQLTGLPNRRHLLERAAHWRAQALRRGQWGALLFLDLDHFKYINDSHGHKLGDQLLCAVAERLRQAVRASDTVARLGGDEFVVLLADLGDGPEPATNHAYRLCRQLHASLAAPHLLGGLELVATPSIGVALLHGAGAAVDELLRQADMAMYQAKARGRNGIAFFEPALQQAAVARLQVESELRQALAGGQLRAWYQPLFDAAGAPYGAEALVRWQHPQRGLLAPAHFLPQAEAAGLVAAIDGWMLRQACQQLAAWRGRPGLGQLRLAVNVSARDFHQADFVARVLQALAASGAAPGQLKLEITESVLLDDLDDAIAKLAALRAAGLTIALDDFGTGYSSLAYLQRLPIDVLKIDRGFVRQALDDARTGAIVRSIIALARTLRLDVVAEGVETAAQLEWLRAAGCTLFQGYYLQPPLAMPEFENALLAQRAGAA